MKENVIGRSFMVSHGVQSILTVVDDRKKRKDWTYNSGKKISSLRQAENRRIRCNE